MAAEIRLGEIEVDVVLKDVKNVHLGVYPPTGRVRITAPRRMSLDTIRVFAISKLSWIRRQRRKIQGQERETPREFVSRESHYAWGRRYLLQVTEVAGAAGVALDHGRMALRVRPGASPDHRRAVVERWYRDQLKGTVPGLIAKWEPLLGVRVRRFHVQRMKTKWGSCSPARGSIRLNAELAKKPPACLDYIVLHEMVHLLEPTHNARFVALMDRFLPEWAHLRRQLNQLPVRHEDWDY